jgi:hypothetical protein
VARIVVVHGIGHQYGGAATLAGSCVPALRDGMTRAGATDVPDVACAFYGDVFRRRERVLGGEPPYRADDVESGFEQELLMAWWEEAARTDPGVSPPDAKTMARTPRSVQAALNALSGSAFFTSVTERLMVSSLRQVRRYLTDPQLRQEITARVTAEISQDTAVVVGHSLGSVVAYEALCTQTDTRVRAFITIGSPLGIRNLVFDRLIPEPGRWPGDVRTWTNIVDTGDVVALVKDLRPGFGERVRNVLVHNGSRAHDMTRYLTTTAVGQAVADGLADATGPARRA